MNTDFSSSCPISLTEYPYVLLAHGGGGKLMHQLIEKMFMAALHNPILETRHDSAVIVFAHFTSGERPRLAFTTDSYVVHPLFFPGGNIGTLAINGTVNDLAMSGAQPLYLSAGFILEEGLEMNVLWRIAQAMQQAAKEAGVQIVTGDTKVVDRGKGDGVFINTSGIGIIEHSLSITPQNVRPGDAVLLSGDIGRHGIAIMAAREGLEFETTIESDCAPLVGLVQALITGGVEIHCLRDLTRGGLGSALVEIAEASGRTIEIEEASIPVDEQVRGACEILGFDPLYVANEGRLVTFVAPQDAERALKVMRQHTLGASANIIGEVKSASASPSTALGLVTMKSRIGATRVIDMLSGEQLPRIC
ncbi:MAG: hydrogenase expression/formation protein HypE [Acidobacteriia bacterium]|nr:hydrogenase expression/formation protein HypE [Terriglobia bacterium]